MKLPVLPLLLLVGFCGSAYTQSSFYVPEFWGTYLVFHILPLLALLLSLVWGKKHSVARVIAYGLCGIAAILGLFEILTMLFFNKKVVFYLITLIASSVGVIVMTRKRKEKAKA